MQRGRGGVRLRRLPGKGERVLHDLFDPRVDRCEFVVGGAGEVAGEARAEGGDGIARRPGVDLGLGPVGSGHRVALVMADGAIGLGLDERRAGAGAGATDSLLHHLPDGDDVIAVDGNARNAIGGGLGGDLGVQRRRGERRRGGVEIVLADEDRRRLLDAGKVQRLVEAAMVDGAIAEKGDADAIRAVHAGADAGADRMADAGGDDAVGAEEADRAVVEMHRAAASAAAAVALAEQLGHQDVGIHALGERMAMAAMGRGDPVGRPQMRADADGGRLLADIKVQEAGRLALAAGDLRDAFEAPQQHHPLIEIDQCGGRQSGRQSARPRGRRAASRCRCAHLSPPSEPCGAAMVCAQEL